MPEAMKPLPPAEWDRRLEHILEDMKGRPLHVHGLMAHHPELLSAWWDFRNYSVVGGELGGRRCELVILRTARHMGSIYEWAHHVQRGRRVGLTAVEVERVKIGPAADGWTEADRLLLQAVDEVNEHRCVTPETLAALSEHFNTRQVMDILAISGAYRILGTMINTWGLELEPDLANEDHQW